MATKNFMSSILDELMGRNRDALPTEVPKQVHWDDPEMCPFYLVCFCPHELFVNTKADLGQCTKFHDEQLKKKYQEEAPTYKRAQCEAEFVRMAEKMIQDIEGKIKRGKLRIALGKWTRWERINSLLSEAEAAGCDGDVEKAQGLMKLCDQLKEERDQLKSNEVSHPWNPDKAMQVCEVCGSYLIIGEAQHRLDDHIMGKQHVGFAMLRKNLEDIKKKQEQRLLEERERKDRERGTGDKGDRDRDLLAPPGGRDHHFGGGGNRGWGNRRGDLMFQSDFRGRGGPGRYGRDDYNRGGRGSGGFGGRDRWVDRDRERDNDRVERVKRHRSRSRSKDKEKKDKDRHKDKKDKDKDKDRESRSRRDEKKRSKKSRSRSRDKDKRSRNRSRSRSKDRKHKDKDGSSSSKRRKDKERDRERDRSERSQSHDKSDKGLQSLDESGDTSGFMDDDTDALPGPSRNSQTGSHDDAE